MMGNWGYGGMGWGGFGLGGELMMLFWVLVPIALIWLGVRAFTGDAGNRADARDFAAERYARGEISREEYQRLRSDLTR